MFFGKIFSKFPWVKAQEEEDELQDPEQILWDKCKDSEQTF